MGRVLHLWWCLCWHDQDFWVLLWFLYRISIKLVHFSSGILLAVHEGGGEHQQSCWSFICQMARRKRNPSLTVTESELCDNAAFGGRGMLGAAFVTSFLAGQVQAVGWEQLLEQAARWWCHRPVAFVCCLLCSSSKDRMFILFLKGETEVWKDW